MGTCWLKDDLRVWLCEQWYNAARILDPEADLLLVDCLSPFEIPVLGRSKLNFIQQETNIGHLESTNCDGWGRTLTVGLEWIMARDYEWGGVWDADVLMTKPMRDIVFYLKRINRRVGSCWCYQHGWLEGIQYFDVNWLRETKFTERYDWKNVKKPVFPERHMQKLMSPELFILPLNGIRDDFQQVTPENIWTLFPSGIDYLTHNNNKNVYEKIINKYNLIFPPK